MKIAFFTDSLPPSTDGVAHTFTRLAETLHKKGYDYKFFSPFLPTTDFPWQNKVTKVPSIPFFLYPQYRISLPTMKEIEQKLATFKPDIVHVSSPTLLGKIGLAYARNHYIPAVSSYHTHFISYFKYYNASVIENLGWSFLKWFYNQFERVYVPSHSAVKDLKINGFDKLELWQRGVNTMLFSPQKRDENWRNSISPKGEPILLFVGRLVTEKDLYDLVEMEHLLKKKKLDFQLVIVGDGPMRKELEKLIPQARFLGFLKGEQLAKVYASSDIFTFPSTTETFGNVVLEAAASGLPVVGVNRGGVPDIILDGRTGFIAEANNPVNFSYYVHVLLSNPNLRKKMACEALRFAQNFDWDHINTRLISSYQLIIKLYQNSN